MADEQRDAMMRRDMPKNAIRIGLLNAKNLPTRLAIIAMLMCTTPALFAQQNVLASLIAQGDRKVAPPFDLIAESGKSAHLSDYRGEVVLLNFWATDCGGCVLEIPSIIEVEKAFRDRTFTVVGISMDIPYENLKDSRQAWDKVRPFLAKRGINYPILMGNESLFKEFGLNQLPDTLLIDKTGKIAAVYVGVISKDNVESNIGQLLSER